MRVFLLSLSLLLGRSYAQLDPAKASLLTGTLRPGLYFGISSRVPQSLLTGIMWLGAHNYDGASHVRHNCDQGDGMESYGYIEHDGRTAATQAIKDTLNNVQITTEFLKIPGGDAGGSWGVRISGKPLNEALLSRISLINYFGNDGSLSTLDMTSEENSEGIYGPVTLSGSTQGLGSFTIRVENGPDNTEVTRGPHADDWGEALERTSYFATAVNQGQSWEAKQVFINAFTSKFKETLEKYGRESPPDPALLFKLPNEIGIGANLYGFQQTYEGTWSVDVYFDSASVPSKLDSATLTVGLAASSAAYSDRFSRTFNLSPDVYSEGELSFARSITANLIGGIGYFAGQSIVDRNFAHEYDDEDEFNGGIGKVPAPQLTQSRELLTATPSRSFFPRGFYWDEGFHLLVVGAWDNDLSLEILTDWINLIDSDGWVGREQILGDEARSRVPKEFQAQYPSYANPPTLAMAVTAYIDRLKAAGISLSSIDPTKAPIEFSDSAESLASRHLQDPILAQEYLKSIYDKLKLHYNWFRETQIGQIRDWGRTASDPVEAYRWRGRTKDHVLTSGLDDYPRALPPHLGELHLDLISWMGFFSKTMREISEFLGETDDTEDFDGNYNAIVANIDDLHWNESEQMYCDASVDSDDESYHVCHRGYISLFPVLLGLLSPSSPHLGPVLDMLRDPEHLWSPYGLRSLSKQDAAFGTGENYWRGPIWIQMNYMALSSLYKIYAKESGPNQIRAGEIYAELRKNVIDNVYNEYVRTGYVWEQYDPNTGEGKRSHPFTGWTSLVTLIMAEKY